MPRRQRVIDLADGDPTTGAGERRVFVAEGKGGRQRMVPVSARFFATLGDYLDQERPQVSTDRVKPHIRFCRIRRRGSGRRR